jgi:hypothetical protein
MTNSSENEKDKSKDRDDKKPQPFEWTEGKLRELFNFLSSLLDRFIAFKDKEFTAEQKYMEATSHHDRRVLYLMIGFLSIVVIAMSALTYAGRVSGDALLFLVGTATGYVFAFVEKFVFGPPVIQVESSE